MNLLASGRQFRQQRAEREQMAERRRGISQDPCHCFASSMCGMSIGSSHIVFDEQLRVSAAGAHKRWMPAGTSLRIVLAPNVNGGQLYRQRAPNKRHWGYV